MNDMTFALSMADAAAEVIRKNFRLGAKREWKGDGTPVTETDFAVNRMVVEAVKAQYPDYGLIGEEESWGDATAEFVWVCDPVDGTIPFAHGIPVSTFCLALVHNGDPVVAVIADPFMERTFSAEKNSGAKLNGETIHVSDVDDIAATLIGLEARALGKDGTDARLTLQKQRAIPLSLASYGYSATLVACGEMSAAVYGGPQPWDTAAAALLVAEAGGRVTDLTGQDQKYNTKVNGLIASNGHVHQVVVDAVSQGEPPLL